MIGCEIPSRKPNGSRFTRAVALPEFGRCSVASGRERYAARHARACAASQRRAPATGRVRAGSLRRAAAHHRCPSSCLPQRHSAGALSPTSPSTRARQGAAMPSTNVAGNVATLLSGKPSLVRADAANPRMVASGHVRPSAKRMLGSSSPSQALAAARIVRESEQECRALLQETQASEHQALDLDRLERRRRSHLGAEQREPALRLVLGHDSTEALPDRSVGADVRSRERRDRPCTRTRLESAGGAPSA